LPPKGGRNAGVADGSAGHSGSRIRGKKTRPKLGALDHPDKDLKSHVRPVSYLGGPAVAGGLVAGLVVGGVFPSWQGGVAIAGAFLLGIIDDRIGVPPWVRLGVQIGIGILLASGISGAAILGNAWPGQWELSSGALSLS